MLGLHLLDSGLALARDGTAVAATPSLVYAPAAAAATTTAGEHRALGADAAALFRARPLDVSTRHWIDIATRSAAASAALPIAGAEIAQRLRTANGSEPDGAAAVVVPALFDAPALGAVLSLLRQHGLRVTQFIDAAVLAAGATRAAGTSIVIEIGLHHFSATRVDSDAARTRRRRSRSSTRAGLVALQELWLQLVSEAMVRRTRFDPLHDAQSEQRLFEALPAALSTAAASGQARVAVDSGAETFEVTLTRDQFATRAAPIYREWIALIHELRSAGQRVCLVAPRFAAALPGFDAMLDQFSGCPLYLLDATTLAVAASRLPDGPGEAVDRAVRLARQLDAATLAACLDPAAASPQHRLLGALPAARAAPTHVLYEGRTWALRGAVVEVGREPAAGGIALPEGTAGLSRLHCSLVDAGGEILLLDHSRYGSFVNGERVAGRVRLAAGDVLRVGDPGVECALIAVGEWDATPPR